MTEVLPQHMQALQRANSIRRDRADLKATIASGGRSAASVVLNPPEYALTMPVLDVLKAQAGWGLHRARRVLVVAQVREGKHLGELTYRQQKLVADLLTWDRP